MSHYKATCSLSLIYAFSNKTSKLFPYQLLSILRVLIAPYHQGSCCFQDIDVIFQVAEYAIYKYHTLKQNFTSTKYKRFEKMIVIKSNFEINKIKSL